MFSHFFIVTTMSEHMHDCAIRVYFLYPSHVFYFLFCSGVAKPPGVRLFSRVRKARKTYTSDTKKKLALLIPEFLSFHIKKTYEEQARN